MTKNKVLIIGPLPLPAGGVSIHIKRLSDLLCKYYFIDFIDESSIVKNEYFNIRTFSIQGYIQKIKKSDVLYVHSGNNALRIFHLLCGFIFSKKIILTIHSYPLEKKTISKHIDQLLYKLANLIIVVNPDILERISLPIKKVVVKNAFLPPEMALEQELPMFVLNWINTKKALGISIICANAWRLEIFEGEDLYGLDMCINAIKHLISKNIPVCCVFNVSSLNDKNQLFPKYTKQIKEENLSEHFLLINESLSFVKLIVETDIVIRPTNTDGDALTIREALYLNKTVIASDIVARPQETILFKSRDVLDLAEKIESTLNTTTAGLNVNELKNDISDPVLFYKTLIDKVLS